MQSGESVADLIYGKHPIEEVLKHNPKSVKMLYLQSGSEALTRFGAALEGMEVPISVHETDRAALDEMCGGGVHQGVAALLTPFAYRPLESMIKKSLSAQGRGIIVVLDQVTDPQNVGSILRAAEAFGADGVVLTERRSSPITATARKASVGAAEIVPIAQVTNLQRALQELKEKGFWIVGTSLSEAAKPLGQVQLPERAVLVLGSEGSGIRNLTEKECDVLVQIPMQGAISSLNVSQAATVLLYELSRQPRAAGTK